MHEKVDGNEVGQHPMVSRILKEYSMKDLLSQGTLRRGMCRRSMKSLSLTDLTHKAVMLLALTRPSRSADLSQLNLIFRRYLHEGVSFQPTKLAKQSRQSKLLAEFSFPALTANHLLCPMTTFRVYEDRTGNSGEKRGRTPYSSPLSDHTMWRLARR